MTEMRCLGVRWSSYRLMCAAVAALLLAIVALAVGCVGTSTVDDRPLHVLRSTPPHDAISPDTRYTVAAVERAPRPDSDTLIVRVVLEQWAPPMQVQAAAYDVLERMEREEDFRTLLVEIFDYPEFAKLGRPTIAWYLFGYVSREDAWFGYPNPQEVNWESTRDPGWRTRPTQQQVDVWAAWQTLVKTSDLSKQEAYETVASQRGMAVAEVKDSVGVCDSWQLPWGPSYE